MSNINEEFNEFYKEQLLGAIAAPREVTDHYCFQACLKDTEGKQTFLVRSKSDGKEFILKRASSDYEGELKNEFETLIFLQNASLPKAINYYEESKNFYLLREYVRGASLYNTVEENGILEEQKAIEIAVEVCRSLNYLHHQVPPIIHRDVKPQNIILTPTGRVVLIDMGTARRFKPDAQHDTNLMGTQATAAPEQYGFGQTDERCDIYAVGVLLVFLVTGGFVSDKNILKTISKPLRKVISKCIALERDKRYSNINSLRLHLEGCLTKRKRLTDICAKIALGIVLFAAGVGLALVVSRQDSVPSAAQLQEAISETAPIQAESPSSIAEQVVVFDSPLIEKAVRLDLQKSDEQPIFESELDKVKQVCICGDLVFSDMTQYSKYDNHYAYNGQTINSQGTISNLDDIARLKNLESLILDKQYIYDISALKDLSLKVLSICGNKVSDISVLQKHKGLTFLKIADNQLTEISTVSALEHLEILDISYNPITEMTPLVKLPIKELWLLDVRIDDYTALKELPALEMLSVNGLNSEQVDLIGTLSHLNRLNIYDSNIKTISVLSKLTQLNHLDIHSNKLSDITGIKDFQTLWYLNISDNYIEDISPLSEIPQLKSISIRSNKINDFSVFVDLPNMDTVFCDNDQSDKLNNLGESLPFTINIQS